MYRVDGKVLAQYLVSHNVLRGKLNVDDLDDLAGLDDLDFQHDLYDLENLDRDLSVRCEGKC